MHTLKSVNKVSVKICMLALQTRTMAATGDDEQVYVMANDEKTQVKVGASVDPNDRRKDADVKKHGHFTVVNAKTAVNSEQAETAAQQAVMKQCGMEQVPGTTDYFRVAGGQGNAKMSAQQLDKVSSVVSQAVDKSNSEQKK